MTKPAKAASMGGVGAPLSRLCVPPAAAAGGAPLWPGLAAFPGYSPLFVQHLLSLQAAGTSLFAAAADTADDEPLNLTVGGADRDRVKAAPAGGGAERAAANRKTPSGQAIQRVSPAGQKGETVHPGPLSFPCRTAAPVQTPVMDGRVINPSANQANARRPDSTRRDPPSAAFSHSDHSGCRAAVRFFWR